MRLYSVYDSKTESYSSPLTCKSHGEALRQFADVANDNNSNISRHPGDFSLFYIGDYDELRGTVCPLEANVNLGCAIELKNKQI